MYVEVLGLFSLITGSRGYNTVLSFCYVLIVVLKQLTECNGLMVVVVIMDLS